MIFQQHLMSIFGVCLLLRSVHSAGVATFTLEEASSVTLTSRDLPTDVPPGSIDSIPPNGIDVYLSETAQKAVQDAISGNCAEIGSLKCQTAIQAALNSQSLQAGQLQPRNGAFVAAGIVAGVAIVLQAIWPGSTAVPTAIHLSPAQLTQVSNIATATNVVAVGGSKTTTFTLPPSPTTATSVPVVSISSGSGDVHISLRDSQARSFMRIMGLPGTCSSGQPSVSIGNEERDVTTTSGCIIHSASALIYNAFTGLASALSKVTQSTRQKLPGFNNKAISAEQTAFVERWMIAATAFGVTSELMAEIAAIAFALAFIWVSRGVALSIDNIISGSLTMTKEDKKCRDPDDNPDKTNLVCALPSCSGDPDIKLCTVDPYKDCACMNPQVNDLEYYDSIMFMLQPNALAQLLAGPPPEEKPKDPLTCASSTTHSKAAYITPKLMREKIDTMCFYATFLVNLPEDWSYKNDYNPGTPEHFSLSITGTWNNDKVEELCKSAIEAILDNCDSNDMTNNPMKFNWGGTYSTQGLNFEIKPLFENRRFPVPKAPEWSCQGDYKGFHSNYGILGVGWSSADFGKNGLFGAIASCIGSNPSDWTFKYFLNDGDQAKITKEWSGSHLSTRRSE